MTKYTGTSATTALIDQRGSLNLLQENGVLLVQVRKAPHRVDTLSTARRYLHVDGVQLTQAEAAIINKWMEVHG